MVGGSELIAGIKRVNEGGIQDQTFFAGEREKGDIIKKEKRDSINVG